jgi:hypothetical protein
MFNCIRYLIITVIIRKIINSTELEEAVETTNIQNELSEGSTMNGSVVRVKGLLVNQEPRLSTPTSTKHQDSHEKFLSPIPSITSTSLCDTIPSPTSPLPNSENPLGLIDLMGCDNTPPHNSNGNTVIDSIPRPTILSATLATPINALLISEMILEIPASESKESLKSESDSPTVDSSADSYDAPSSSYRYI